MIIGHVAGEILAQSLSQLERDIHLAVIIFAYKALKVALEIVKRISIPIDVHDDEQMLSLIKTSVGTKLVMRWSDLMCKLALRAISCCGVDRGETSEDLPSNASPLPPYACCGVDRGELVGRLEVGSDMFS